MTKRKKVLLISQRYLPNKGGIENSLRHLSEEFANLDFDVDIVCSDVNSENSQKLPLSTRVNDKVNIRRYKYKNVISSMINLSILLRNLNVKNYDLIVSRSHITSFCLMFFTSPKKVIYLVPGVVREQNSIEKIGLSGLRRLKANLSLFFHSYIQKHVFRRVKIVCFSQMMSKNVTKLAGGKKRMSGDISLLSPGLDVARFSLGGAVLGSSDCSSCEEIRLLCVSRLVWAKGIHYVLGALAQLPDNYKLYIVGDGPIKSDLQRLAMELHVSGRVSFLGALDTPELIYKKSHIFCFSSTYEPFGQTILEAMACGLTVVSFNSNEVATVVDELVPRNYLYCADSVCAASYADAIRRVRKTNFNEFNRKELSSYALRNFKWEDLARGLLEKNDSV